MKDWENLKNAQDCLLVAIYANQIHVYQNEKELSFTSFEPVIKMKNPESDQFWYWKLDWFEDEIGDDFLTIQEQETPEPLEYRQDPIIAPKQHIILGSGYVFQQQNIIKKVTGYGYKDEKIEILGSIVFELQKSFVTFTTGAVITTKISDQAPHDLGSVIFSL